MVMLNVHTMDTHTRLNRYKAKGHNSNNDCIHRIAVQRQETDKISKRDNIKSWDPGSNSAKC